MEPSLAAEQADTGPLTQPPTNIELLSIVDADNVLPMTQAPKSPHSSDETLSEGILTFIDLISLLTHIDTLQIMAVRS